MIIDALEKISTQGDRDGRQKNATRRSSVGLQISKHGHLVVIGTRTRLSSAIRPSFANRGDVREFSRSSAVRLRRYLRGTLAEYRVLITLTYPHNEGMDGGRAKRDLKCFMQRLARYQEGKLSGHMPCDYGSFWFLEFQQRGSIHFHIFTTHYVPKEWVSKSWYEIVGSEDERHLQAGTRTELIRSGRYGVCAYAAKYAAKHEQKVVPADFGWVGRFWGAVGYRATVAADTYVEPEDAWHGVVNRRLRDMEKVIYEEKREGRLTIRPTDGGFFIIYCKTIACQARMEWAIEAIETAVRMWNPRPRMNGTYFSGEIGVCTNGFEDLQQA